MSSVSSLWCCPYLPVTLNVVEARSQSSEGCGGWLSHSVTALVLYKAALDAANERGQATF